MSITIRTATLADVDALAALNRAAYPDLVQDGVVFDAGQMRGHQLRFPAGQLVAELDGQIVGAIATMIPPRALDPLAPHTWMGITDAGSFERHDAGGDTLYLADIYVHQRAWGSGVGRALYAALFALCRKLGLANVVGGGRLYDYVDAEASIAPATYVAQVIRGERRDRVLQSQLRAGFEVRGLLPGYLHDGRSRHVATLIVWDNPDRVTVTAGVRAIEARVRL
ncbi:MAG: GNAT family N-acetyltransferase [Myxococcales bacterium]|nr:GNAT family N-acetyltransferase [Myxococcales bacterium]